MHRPIVQAVFHAEGGANALLHLVLIPRALLLSHLRLHATRLARVELIVFSFFGLSIDKSLFLSSLLHSLELLPCFLLLLQSLSLSRSQRVHIFRLKFSILDGLLRLDLLLQRRALVYNVLSLRLHKLQHVLLNKGDF